ncbi:methylated-DNA--[protein]-cysteine S-methyltransferase [Halorubellus sp. JP-L1]|uniref:methylated-DNA--[protein]-cysteine S-methyltransferase n=1 Tax=Halorubellus sp. JP-L1 TaxID=2715753 RepID=UPI0014092484|nr:methylated-DNA--[protein]-cysteine S-methyltransferase [Halorubellus sp. JP-L1]NHN41223.1 methylated-DNA--[protein]-cysteine S-methyltransferase [Halorubellus sp. JP-L1]
MQVSLVETTIEVDERAVDAPTEELRRQVREYARGDRRTFDLDVDAPTEFAGAAMAAMRDIPYGETRTYGDLAADLDTSAVAVGGACARNPVPVVVPCHRVVASDGGLRGYSANGGVDTKRRLLEFEATHVEDATVQSTLGTDPTVRSTLGTDASNSVDP